MVSQRLRVSLRECLRCVQGQPEPCHDSQATALQSEQGVTYRRELTAVPHSATLRMCADKQHNTGEWRTPGLARHGTAGRDAGSEGMVVKCRVVSLPGKRLRLERRGVLHRRSSKGVPGVFPGRSFLRQGQ